MAYISYEPWRVDQNIPVVQDEWMCPSSTLPVETPAFHNSEVLDLTLPRIL